MLVLCFYRVCCGISIFCQKVLDSESVTDERDLLSLFTYDDARILSSSCWGSKTKTPLNEHIFEAVICLRLKEFENGVNIWGGEGFGWGLKLLMRHTNANLFWHWLRFHERGRRGVDCSAEQNSSELQHFFSCWPKSAFGQLVVSWLNWSVTSLSSHELGN